MATKSFIYIYLKTFVYEKVTTTFFMPLLGTKTYGQTPYRLYGHYEKALFTNNYDDSSLNVFSLKPADTQPTNGDSVFVKKYNLMQKDISASPYFFSCDGSFNDTLWHGNALVLAANGRQLLTTAQNDTLTIRVMSSLGQTWKALQYSNGTYWQAQVDSVSLQNIIGLTDSVKTISFWKKAADGTSIFDDNNGVKMKISRQYGLVSTPSILNFPTQKLQLAGFDNPQKGVQNLTAAQIYDMQIGDEFHIVSLFNANYPYGLYNGLGTKSILKVTSRTTSATGDSIIYQFNNNASTTVVYNIPALAQKLDLLPQSVYFTYSYSPDEIMAQRTIQKPFDNYLQQKIHRAYFIHTYDSSNCYQGFFEENLYEKYIQGCGGPYYGFFDGNGYYMHDLVYYKKGNHTWGTPLSSQKIQSNLLAVSLSPMPCKEFVTLSFAQKPFEGTAIIYDILGQKVSSQYINSTNKYRLALDNHLPAGVYNLALQQPDGLTQMLRLIKE